MNEARRADRQVPAARSAAVTRGSVEQAPPLPTVLLVDDVTYLRDLASSFLARTSRVLTAGDGAEALAVARADRPDLIVSDMRMPGMNGVELCKTLARERALAGVPFIMLVSDATGVERGRAIRAGATDVLSKPLSRQSLLESVRRLLRHAPQRSLPRIATDLPVGVSAVSEMGDERERTIEKGVVRNLSRGGVFLETDCALARQAEVRLHFRLPGSPDLLMPSAQVVWGRRARPDAPDPAMLAAGFGLRFLEIDDAACRIVDDFVYERTPRTERGSGGTQPSESVEAVQ